MANEQEVQLGKEQIDSAQTSGTILGADAATILLDGTAKVTKPVFQANNAQGANQQVINNQQPPVVQNQQTPPQPVTPAVETAPLAPVTPEEYFVELEGGSKVSVPAELYNHVTTLRENAETYANRLEAFQEFEKDPNAFLTKHAPHIIIKQFDQNAFVKAGLEKDFGADFNFDYTKAYEVGSSDYNYRLRQDELVQEARGLSQGAQNTILEQETQAKEVYHVATEAARVKLGVDENTWNTQVLSVINNAKQDEIIELIARSVLSKNNNIEYKANLEKAAAISNQVTPASVISQGTQNHPAGNTDKDKMGSVFGLGAVNQGYASLRPL